MKDLVFRAPAAAYRADLGDREVPFGPDDDRWLVAAIELHHAARSQRRARKQHLYAAIGVGIDVLGDERIENVAEREWRGERTYCDPAILLADAIHYAGALRLAAGMMDDVQRAAPDLPISHVGRLLSMRARIAWKLGALEDAAERYEHIALLGRTARDLELQALGELGHATLAQLRGHFPELRARVAALLGLAEQSGNRSIVRAAYNAAMIAHIKSGDADAALIAGWRAWELSAGFDVWEAESLVNLAQVMMDCGHPEKARAGFAAALERSAPAWMLLGALGGLALSSAMTDQEATVEWTVREVSRAHTLPVAPYAVGLAELECAEALARLGRAEEAERHRRAAVEIGRRHRFSEIVYKAEDLDPSDLPRRAVALGTEAERYATQLEALEPERLPNEVQFEAAPT